MLGYVYATTLWTFVWLNILKSLSNAFMSGSMEALVYDSLKQEGRDGEYDKVVANIESISWVALCLSSISGGFMYFYWHAAPYFFQGLLYLISAVVAMGLIEPLIDSKKYNWKEVVDFNLRGFRELFANVKLTQLTVVLIVVGTGYLVASEMMGIAQAKEYGLDSRGAGILFGVGYILSAIASQFYPRLSKKIGSRRLLIMATSILLLSFLLAKWTGVVVGGILIVMRISSATTFRNVRSSLINRLIRSTGRATTLSTLNLLTQLPMALMAYFLGDFIDRYSPNNLAWLMGWAMVVVLISQQFIFRDRIKYEPNL
jgi:MFS family permease